MKLIELPTLPVGWEWSTVAELGTLGEQTVLTGPFGSKMQSKDFALSGVAVLTIGCLADTGIDLEKANHLPELKAAELERYSLSEGDMLFSRMASVGRACKIPKALEGALFNYHLMRLRLRDDACISDFFLVYVRGSKIVRDYLRAVNHGATRDAINTKQLLNLPVPTPPLYEQRRIVAKIEEMSERSRRAREALEAIPPLLERFRQSVLAAAFRGDLTREWREQNPDVEPASKLLERIRKERRRRWEEDYLAKQKAKGKTPKNDKWKEKYKEPEPVDTTGLSELPEGWCWTTVEECGLVSGGLTKNSKRREFPRRIPYLRVANVYADELRLDEVKEIGITDAEINRVLLRKGDLLVVEGNGSVDQIGRVALWDGSVSPCAHQNHLIKVRFLTPGLGPVALRWFMSPRGRQQVEHVASSTSGLHTLSLSKVNALPFPLMPPEEAKIVVSRVGLMIQRVRGFERHLGSADATSSKLNQSILAKAFRGELVPQDPNDEPASVLLERIRAEREAVKPKKRRGRTKKAKASAVTTPSAPGRDEKHDSRSEGTAGEADAGRQGELFTQPQSRPATKPSGPRQDERRGIDDYTREEVEKALRGAWGGRDDVEPDDVLKAASRALGFKRLGSKIRERLESVLEDLD